MALSYPPGLPDVDRNRIERALEAAIPSSHLDGLGSSIVRRRYDSEAAAVYAVVAVCEVIAVTLMAARLMAAADRQAAATDFLEQVIRWAYVWHPSPDTRPIHAFAAAVCDDVQTRLFWLPFRVGDVNRRRRDASSAHLIGE